MMKKLLTLLLTAVLCVSMVACGGNDSGESQTNENENSAAADQTDDSGAEEALVTNEELYGTYVSSLDDQFTVILTQEEHTRNEDDTVILTSPVYFCRRGEEAIPVGVYSWEIEGDLLTFVTWFGETIPYQIVKENDSIQLIFLKDQYSFSVFDAPSPENQAFLSDLTKE